MKFFTYFPKKSKGFTLIELLVVISIIAFLSSVVIATTNTARAKARDAKKLSDAKQVSTAMEMWYSDNKTMPSSLNQLVPKYLSQVPDNFTYKVATSSGVAVAYTTYETKNTPSGADQQVGAVLVDDQSSGNLCSMGLGFPACDANNTAPLDQIVDVSNGQTANSSNSSDYFQQPLTCSDPQKLSDDKTSCVCINPDKIKDGTNCNCPSETLADGDSCVPPPTCDSGQIPDPTNPLNCIQLTCSEHEIPVGNSCVCDAQYGYEGTPPHCCQHGWDESTGACYVQVQSASCTLPEQLGQEFIAGSCRCPYLTGQTAGEGCLMRSNPPSCIGNNYNPANPCICSNGFNNTTGNCNP